MLVCFLCCCRHIKDFEGAAHRHMEKILDEALAAQTEGRATGENETEPSKHNSSSTK